MNDAILFKEKQRFTQWWIWVLLLLANGLFFFGAYRQIIKGKDFGNNPMSNAGLIVVIIFMLLLTVFLLSLQLETTIKKDGIYVRLFPFHISYKKYTWSMITKAYVRKYSPIGEYGGWGLRTGFSGKSGAWNVRGNMGLQLVFTTGKKLLIGTQKPEELSQVLLSINQNREVGYK